MSKFLRLFLILWLIPICTSFAQDVPMLHYTKGDGLPSNTIYSVYRDSKGFLWIATDKGIARYNGISFEKFTTFDGLPDNEVFFFQEDSYGRLWLATYNGMLCYYKDGKFHTAINTSFLKLPGKVSFVRSIHNEKDSSVTISFCDETFFVNIKNEQTKIFNLKKIEYNGSKTQYSIEDIHKINANSYEIFGADHNIFLDSQCVISKIIVKDPYEHALKFNQNKLYIFDSKFVYVENKQYRYHFRGHVYSLPTFINNVYINDNNLLIATKQGLYINGSRILLGDESVSCVTQDINGNYWVSVLGAGLYCINKYYLDHTTYRGINYRGKIVFSSIIKGNLFFAGDNGDLFIFNNETIKSIFSNPTHSKNTLINSCFCVDTSNNFYGFYMDFFIIIKNSLSSKPKTTIYKDNLQTVPSSLYTVHNGLYWQVRKKIVYLNLNSLKPGCNVWNNVRYIVDDTDNTSRIFCTTMDDENKLWYSTINNVIEIVDTEVITDNLLHKYSFRYFTFSGRYVIGCTTSNQLLIGELEGNMVKFDTVPQQKCIWDKFYKIDNNHILIGTDEYYYILDFQTNKHEIKYNIYSIDPSLIPFNPESITSDGRIVYFFSKGVIVRLPKVSFLEKPEPPKLFFTNVETNSTQEAIDTVTELPYEQAKNITIDFSTLSMREKNVFVQYSISNDGRDSWRNINGEKLTLVETDYGTYTIKLRARTPSSFFSEPIFFTLKITRPFWVTWWFIAVCALCCVAFISLLIRIRVMFLVNLNKKKHDNEVKFLRSEFKALNALMNPHFIFNTLNNVQSLFNGDNKLAANEYLRIFANLIRQNMHNVSKDLITMEQEITLVKNYLLLEKLRFEDKLEYEINVDENVDISEVLVPPLLIQPLVENSIKHGIFPLDKGAVIINLYIKNNFLIVEIKDNGVGFGATSQVKEDQHESFGLQNIRRRIEQLSIIQGKQISLEFIEEHDVQQKWTIVRLSIPY